MQLSCVYSHQMSLNIRRTPARTTIVEFLNKSNSPVDISQIIAFLREKNLNTNKVTVYRAMEFLLGKGFIDKVEFGEGKYRYEIKKGDHHHLICTNCGSVKDIKDKYMNELEKEIQESTGFMVKNHSMEFFGLCKNCQN